jgi:serine/threonine protein kinase
VEKSTNAEFAMKIVNKADTNAREMDSELSVMARLQHQNIVFFKEIFDAPDGYYVVLEKYVQVWRG